MDAQYIYNKLAVGKVVKAKILSKDGKHIQEEGNQKNLKKLKALADEDYQNKEKPDSNYYIPIQYERRNDDTTSKMPQEEKGSVVYTDK